jgi:cytidine deaminase
VLSYGENKYKSGIFPTVHAEDDAINKLPSLTNKRIRKVDILVIRANIGGTVGNSKPCTRCIQVLEKKLPKRGYVLDTIHYTTVGGTVVSRKFSDLLSEGGHHVTKFFANR